MEEFIKYTYRVGLIGFFIGGAIGTASNGTSLADAPAIVVASNAVVNGYQGAAVGVIVGVILGFIARAKPVPLPPPTTDTDEECAP